MATWLCTEPLTTCPCISCKETRLEAEAAALREGLNKILIQHGCNGQGGACQLCPSARTAFTTTAGIALLKRLEAAERVVEAARLLPMTPPNEYMGGARWIKFHAALTVFDTAKVKNE